MSLPPKSNEPVPKGKCGLCGQEYFSSHACSTVPAEPVSLPAQEEKAWWQEDFENQFGMDHPCRTFVSTDDYQIMEEWITNTIADASKLAREEAYKNAFTALGDITSKCKRDETCMCPHQMSEWLNEQIRINHSLTPDA